MKFINTTIVASVGVLFLTSLIYLTTFTYYLTGTRLKLFCLHDKCITCEVAQQIAEEGFKKGECNLISGGFSGEPSFLTDVLEADYNITLIRTGCGGVSDELDCYNMAMEKLLEKKYGEDFYKNAWTKAAENRKQYRLLHPYKVNELLVPSTN